MSILFFDLDGTLLVGENGISKECAEELRRVRALGHRLVLNTGRSPAFVPKDLWALSVWDGRVCGSSYVEWKGKILENTPLSGEILQRVYDWSIERGAQVLFEGVEEVFSVCGSFPDASEIFRRMPMPQITKVTFWCDPFAVEQKDFPGLRIIRFERYAEGILGGKSKSTGMAKILEAEGLARKDSWAFGDSENDREMLMWAGSSVCMPGAPEDFDRICIYRCREKDGVPEALKKFF